MDDRLARRDRGGLLAFVIAGLLLALAGPVRAQDPTGVYVGELLGESLEVVLEPGGRALVEGEPWRWKLEGEQVLIFGPDGEGLVGQVSGSRLTLTLEDGDTMELRRTAGGAEGQITKARPKAAPRSAPPAAKPPKATAPKASLPGKRVTPEGQPASLVVPKGWRHQWGSGPSGGRAYVVTPPGGEGQGVIAITLMPLSGQDASRSIPELLRLGAEGLLGGTPATVTDGPREFQVDKRRAGRLILAVQARAPDGSVRTLEGNLAGVMADDFAYVFLGVYAPEHASLLRAGMDTLVASLKVPKIKENRALKARLAGCWTRYSGDTSGGSSHSDQATYWLNPDGSYLYQGAFSVSGDFGGAVSKDEARGRYRVVGQVLHLFPEQGAPTSVAVQLQGGRLLAGGQAFLPCR